MGSRKRFFVHVEDSSRATFLGVIKKKYDAWNNYSERLLENL